MNHFFFVSGHVRIFLHSAFRLFSSYHSSIDSVKSKSIEKHLPEDDDDELLRDVVTINPHPYSPPLSSSSSHHLISSSSTTSSNSSTSTVLLKSEAPAVKPPPPSVSQLPKRLTSISTSRLKVPTATSKIRAPATTATPNAKTTKTMINSTTSSLRKPSTINGNNQSSAMTNSLVNKTIPQQVKNEVHRSTRFSFATSTQMRVSTFVSVYKEVSKYYFKQNKSERERRRRRRRRERQLGFAFISFVCSIHRFDLFIFHCSCQQARAQRRNPPNSTPVPI